MVSQHLCFGPFEFSSLIIPTNISSFTASVWMTCHAEECKLEISPPGSSTSTLDFARAQLLSAHAIKTDNEGNFLKFDDSKYNPAQRGMNKKGKYKNTYKGADEHGEYRSYAIKFKASTKSGEKAEDSEDDVPDGDFNTIMQFLSPGEEEGTYMLYMRKFGMVHSRTRVRSMINKIESYVKKRRQKLVLKESVTLAWQAILCLVLGFMGTMMTLLIGQFRDEPVKKQGGPGARRGAPKKKADKDSKFYYDTGRPSKYPPGYKKY
jgi:hypothetical protein